MSMEIDKEAHSHSKKQKRSKDESVDVSEKKRKRRASDEVDLGSPTKKHKSKKQSVPATGLVTADPISTAPTKLPIYQQTSSLYLSLPPISQRHALHGLCAEHLSPLILTYYPPFKGVILSYSNVRLSTNSQDETQTAYSQAVDEYAASFIWLIADFVVFRPQKGDVLEGWVNLQNESNIGLLCLNFFNATIDTKRLSKEWKWIPPGTKSSMSRKLKPPARNMNTDTDEDEDQNDNEDEDARNNQSAGKSVLEDMQGYFVDGHGRKVEGLIRFSVRNVETSRTMDRENSFLSIEGTMLSKEEENELKSKEQTTMRTVHEGMEKRYKAKKAKKGDLKGRYDGNMDSDSVAESASVPKHRAKY